MLPAILTFLLHETAKTLKSYQPIEKVRQKNDKADESLSLAECMAVVLKRQQRERDIMVCVASIRSTLKDVEISDAADQQSVLDFYHTLASYALGKISLNYAETKVVMHRNPDFIASQKETARNPSTIKVMAYTFAETFEKEQTDFLAIMGECTAENFVNSSLKKTYQAFCQKAKLQLAVFQEEVQARKNLLSTRGSRGVLDYAKVMEFTQIASPLLTDELRDQHPLPVNYVPPIYDHAVLLSQFKHKTLVQQCEEVEGYLQQLKKLFSLPQAKKLDFTHFATHAHSIVSIWKKSSLCVSHLPWGSAAEKKAAHQHLFNIYVILEDHGWRCENGKATGLENNRRDHFTLFLSAIEGASFTGDSRDHFSAPLKQLTQLIQKCNQLKKSQMNASEPLRTPAIEGNMMGHVSPVDDVAMESSVEVDTMDYDDLPPLVPLLSTEQESICGTTHALTVRSYPGVPLLGFLAPARTPCPIPILQPIAPIRTACPIPILPPMAQSTTSCPIPILQPIVYENVSEYVRKK